MLGRDCGVWRPVAWLPPTRVPHESSESAMFTLLLLSSLVQVPKDKESKRDPEAMRGPPEVIYVGRFGYSDADGSEPMMLRILRDGKIIADKPVEITDEDLKVSIPKYCAGKAKVTFSIGVMEPDKTTLRTIEKTMNRVKKHVPPKTSVKFVIHDAEM
jgi:hypothetical protein